MITENVLLKRETKKKLQHLSIDKDVYISTMLIDMAKKVLSEDINIERIELDNDCDPFTMKIEVELKEKIRDFCKKKDIRIKDFWNEVGLIIINTED